MMQLRPITQYENILTNTPICFHELQLFIFFLVLPIVHQQALITWIENKIG